MKAPVQSYLETKVKTANSAELRLMLFDGAIRFAQQGKDAMAKGEWEFAFNGITRCQSILLELTNSLRPEHDPKLCDQLSSLYTFMYTRLINANSQRDAAIVDEVLTLLKFERETWSMLLDQLAAENKAAAARATDVPADVKPVVPPLEDSVGHLIGATVSLRG